MRRLNLILLAIASALLLASALLYHHDATRAARFERGQALLPNLNPDAIAAIELRAAADADAAPDAGAPVVRLERGSDPTGAAAGERFVVASAGDYPADNAAVNRLIRDALDIDLDKEIGADAALFDELDLADGAAGATDVAFFDASGAPMVRFRVGRAFADGAGDPGGGPAGHYVRRLDAEPSTAYLTQGRVYLTVDADSYLDKTLLDVASSEVVAVRGGGDPSTAGYVVARDDASGAGTLALRAAGAAPAPAPTDEATAEIAAAAPASFGLAMASDAVDAAKVNQLGSLLDGLRFTTPHRADAAVVRGLVFDAGVRVELRDQSGYTLRVASREAKHFLTIEAFHDVGEVRLARDASEAEVAATADVLARNDALQAFNSLHGSWVYEISDVLAEKIRWTRDDLRAADG